MINDHSPQVATDTPSNESREHRREAVPIDEALERYSRPDSPRIPRSIQRYCAKGDLDCRRAETSIGEKWLILPASVDKHISWLC